MAEYAAKIYRMRTDYIKKLELYANAVMKDISGGKEDLKLSYKSDILNGDVGHKELRDAYFEIFTREIEREKIVGSSLWGPHRDDMEITINGVSARSYASQGQQRSIVLALKLAEGEVCREICGEYPVYLFDDVLSELDAARREYVLSDVGEKQIIITSCEPELSGINASNVIEVTSGTYERR
jgi:DNA replication and repair protein RecF